MSAQIRVAQTGASSGEAMVTELRLPALEIRQAAGRVLYTFGVDGKRLPSFATISRIHRGAGFEILGYQRTEVLSHIAEIRRYIESPDPVMPNAIVIAFDERVRFEEARAVDLGAEDCRVGSLVIPIESPAVDRPGWIVDGQQRAAAIREARVDRFPISVVAFIASSAAEQRKQFILVNSTRPLPKGLIYELLPSTEGRLSLSLERRRFPSRLLARLNHDEDSPLRGYIRTPTCVSGIIKDTAVLKVIENSLHDGALYRLRDPKTGEGDVERMLQVLKDFWRAVAAVFKDAWGLPPRRSRLMHGAGIVSMGFVMDAIADRIGQSRLPAQEEFEENLRTLKSACRWTSGFWELGEGVRRRWCEIQNTSKDIRLLSNFLLLQYRRKPRGPESSLGLRSCDTA